MVSAPVGTADCAWRVAVLTVWARAAVAAGVQFGPGLVDFAERVVSQRVPPVGDLAPWA